MNLILGASGELGSCLAQESPATDTILLKRSEVNEWVKGGETFIRKELVDSFGGTTKQINIFYCIGNTNPNAKVEILDTLNFQLPKSIAKASDNLPIRLITFGNVHEDSKIYNPYMDSKRRFRDFLLQQESHLEWNHFQLHTLYSETLPKTFMFLGQMLESIRIGDKFTMSSGKQLRQFHHTSDVVHAIYSLLPDIKGNSVLQVSSKHSIRLADLASTIFSQRGELGSLEIGSMEDLENEVYLDVYRVPESLKSHDFRNPLIEIPKLVSHVWLPNQFN